MKEQIIIRLGEVTIRPWQTTDVDSLVRHADNRKIWLNVRDRFPHPYTRRDAEIWVRVAQADRHMINLAIEVDQQAIGGIGVVFKQDVYKRSAEIGYWLGEDYWGRGITTRCVKALTGYVMQHHDIVRMYAGIFDYNAASARVLEKAGYTLEARLRMNVTKDGHTVDELMYAKIKE
jgi:RimJ/RimL family protein N-acetyltransferase